MKKQEPLNIKIEASLKAELDRLAVEQDLDVSNITRMALRTYLFLVKTKKLMTVTNWVLESISSEN